MPNPCFRYTMVGIPTLVPNNTVHREFFEDWPRIEGDFKDWGVFLKVPGDGAPAQATKMMMSSPGFGMFDQSPHRPRASPLPQVLACQCCLPASLSSDPSPALHSCAVNQNVSAWCAPSFGFEQTINHWEWYREWHPKGRSFEARRETRPGLCWS